MDGRGIPPYRMAQLVKAASKIVDMIVNGTWQLSYEEISIILELVQTAAERSRNIEVGEEK